RYRLGVNHHQIPVNQPKSPTHSYHRDGSMRVDGNMGSTLDYNPNSYDEWDESPEYEEPDLDIHGAASRWNFREDDDNYFEQPGKLFRLMNEEEKERLFANTARAMEDVEDHIKKKHIKHCYLADPAYGEGVAEALGLPIEDVKETITEE